MNLGPVITFLLFKYYRVEIYEFCLINLSDLRLTSDLTSA